MSTLSRKFIGFQQFTTSGTWVKKPNVRALLVVCIGGGRGNVANGGNSSFSTCVGTGGNTTAAGVTGTGGDLNLSSGISQESGWLISAMNLGPGANSFGFSSGINIGGQANTGLSRGALNGTNAQVSGATAIKLFDASTLPDTVAVTVGAGGGTGVPGISGQVYIFEVS